MLILAMPVIKDRKKDSNRGAPQPKILALKFQLTDNGTLMSTEVRPKRRKTIENLKPEDCNQTKCKGVVKRFRISESNRARNLINAANFTKGSIYTRCILYKTTGDIFAAGVMCHKKCMEIYISQFMRDIDNLMSSAEVNDDPCLEDAFEKVLQTLELDKCGYSLPDCRELMNKELHETGVGKFKIPLHFITISTCEN